jgi:PPOX class probable F420-dependent enzyme
MGILPDSGRAAERLDSELVGWLTSITPTSQPQSSVVWFVVDDDVLFIQSRADAPKVANIAASGKVSFHLDGNGEGGDIVTIDGTAEVLDSRPPGLQELYLEKYERMIRESLHMSPDAFLADYNTTIRVTPRRVRAW